MDNANGVKKIALETRKQLQKSIDEGDICFVLNEDIAIETADVFYDEQDNRYIINLYT